MGKRPTHWSDQKWGAWPAGWSEAAARDRLNAGERATLAGLALAADFRTGALSMSRDEIAKQAGIHPRTVDRAIDGDKRRGRPGLEALGYLIVTDRGGGRGQRMNGRLSIPGQLTGGQSEETPVQMAPKPRSVEPETPVRVPAYPGQLTGSNNRTDETDSRCAAVGDLAEALAEAGINEPALSRLAALAHLTPAMVRDHAARCRREGKRGGLLIGELEAAHAEQAKQAETTARRERAAAWWADLADDERRGWADRVRAEHGNGAADDHESMPVWAWKLKQTVEL